VKSINLAVIAGDGIGPEVTSVGIAALEKALGGVELDITSYDLGSDRYLETGEALTENDLEQLAKHDAILLGAIGDPRVPSGVLERGLLLKLRFAFDHHINLRPSKLFEGVVSPLSNAKNIDFVVVREGTEGPYVGNGGAIRQRGFGQHRIWCPQSGGIRLQLGIKPRAQARHAGSQNQRFGSRRQNLASHGRRSSKAVSKGDPRLHAHRCCNHSHGEFP